MKAPIIDAHTHIFPDEVRKDRGGCCKRDKGFSSIYQDSKARMVGAEELIASMDEHGVERSVICGFPWSETDLCSLHNQYLVESASRYPSRLIAFITLLPTEAVWSEKEFQNWMGRGIKGVGELAFYDREMTSRDMEALRPILTEMGKKGIPLLLHVNETLGHSYPGKGRTPIERFYELILSFPDLPVILAHWGGGLPFYELMPEVARHMVNVYYDTAASPYLYSSRIYRAVKEIVGVEKILFGSDFPLLSPRRYFEELEGSGLSEEDRQRILGLNLSNLLGLGLPVS